ncbi:hypothetical protein MTO96_045447 [Rhipicephalus appendiculatus]
MAALAVPATFAVAFAYLKATYDQRRCLRREVGDAFDMPDDAFWRHFRLSKETVWWLCDEVADELGGARPTALSVERQPAVSKCVRRVAPAIVNAIVAPRGKQKAAFFCRKGYYALNVMFICDVDMRILAVALLRLGSDPDSHIWGTTGLRERFADGRIDTTGSRTKMVQKASSTCTCFDAFRSGALYWATEEPLSLPSAVPYPPLLSGTFCMCSVQEGDSVDNFSDDSGDESSDHDSAVNDDDQPRLIQGRTSRFMYLSGQAVRNGVVSMFGTTRQQHQQYLKRVCRRLRRLHQRQRR